MRTIKKVKAVAAVAIPSLLWTPTQAAKALGLGRTSFWKLVYVQKAIKPVVLPGTTRVKYRVEDVTALAKPVALEDVAKLKDKRRKN